MEETTMKNLKHYFTLTCTAYAVPINATAGSAGKRRWTLDI